MFPSARALVRSLAVLLALAVATASAIAQDWTNSGGNAQRNGLTDAYGP